MSAALRSVLAEIDQAIADIKAAFGAPGDYGYETSEGRALFGLYKARAALTGELAQIVAD